ncbi:MAG: AI-2E family transporter [Candidatus Woesearchaeota archaeon]
MAYSCILKKRVEMAKKIIVHKNDHFIKYFFIGILVLVLFVSFLIVKPFINVILASAAIAYIFYPAYNFINKRIHNKSICALLVSFFIIILIAVPFALLLPASATEAQYAYIRVKQKILAGEILDVDCSGKESTLLCRTSYWVQLQVKDPEVKFYLQDTLEKITSYAIQKTSSLLLALPKIILEFIVTFFILFYLFKDGSAFVVYLKRLIPMKEVHRNHVALRINETAHAVIYGSLVIALIQGILATIGYWIFGIESFIFWGIATAVFALVPIIGTTTIWLPASIFLIAKGSTEANPTMIYSGIGLLIYGALIISTADNILKPKLIGDRAGLHPVLVLLGVLGGLALFGFAGFLIGPLILAILKSMLDIFEKEGLFNDHKPFCVK